jgi:hypothetical protein
VSARRWYGADRDNPDYTRGRYMRQQHHARYRAYVKQHGMVCQDCGGRGCSGYDSDYGPAEPCGWCETTGMVTRWLRGLWLRVVRDEKRKRSQRRRVVA